MTAISVSRTQLRCDGGCETVRTYMALDVTGARIEAAADGWRYGTRKDRGRRVVDVCPQCQIPEGYAVSGGSDGRG